MTDDERHDNASPPPARRELPEPPDPARVEDLRRRLRRDQSERGGGPAGFKLPNVPANEEAGRRARDIGAYTIIPMMLLAGPAIGYLLGLGVERVLGGKPWPSLAGMLWGLAAAFRQVYLILKNRGEEARRGK